MPKLWSVSAAGAPSAELAAGALGRMDLQRVWLGVAQGWGNGFRWQPLQRLRLRLKRHGSRSLSRMRHDQREVWERSRGHRVIAGAAHGLPFSLQVPTVRIRYFTKTNTLLIESRDAEIAETRDLDENTVLDLDAVGQPVRDHGGTRLGAHGHSRVLLSTGCGLNSICPLATAQYGNPRG
jgi:hypothetical protein